MRLAIGSSQDPKGGPIDFITPVAMQLLKLLLNGHYHLKIIVSLHSYKVLQVLETCQHKLNGVPEFLLQVTSTTHFSYLTVLIIMPFF